MSMSSRRRLLTTSFVATFAFVILLTINPPAHALVDSVGNNTYSAAMGFQWVFAFKFTASASGTVTSIGVNIAGSETANAYVGLYSDSGNKPSTLLTTSALTALNTVPGWQDISVTAYTAYTAGITYWVAIGYSTYKSLYYGISGTRSYYVKTFGAFDGTWSAGSTQDSGYYIFNMRVTYTSGPDLYSFNVKASATQIMVTLTYSWSGSGSPPLGNITIAGPGGTPTLYESGAVVYDRTSITVSGGTNTYSIIHRATFTITAPGSAQTWTALISLVGVSNYNVAIEVS